MVQQFLTDPAILAGITIAVLAYGNRWVSWAVAAVLIILGIVL